MAREILQGLRDRAFGNRSSDRIRIPVFPEENPLSEPDQYYYGKMAKLINISFGADIPNSMPTEVVTGYFDSWKEIITPEDKMIAEKYERLWRPIMQTLDLKEKRMIARAMRSIRVNKKKFPVIADLREMSYQNVHNSHGIGKISQRFFREAFKVNQ